MIINGSTSSLGISILTNGCGLSPAMIWCIFKSGTLNSGEWLWSIHGILLLTFILGVSISGIGCVLNPEMIGLGCSSRLRVPIRWHDCGLVLAIIERFKSQSLNSRVDCALICKMIRNRSNSSPGVSTWRLVVILCLENCNKNFQKLFWFDPSNN